ncbi:MAG: helix-turn-helix transcriptional regulator, partial [Dehalococcoidia bacterium]|nr:helix-turn-helix transcriptional regulator [Dehalococcoidia bacterium]
QRPGRRSPRPDHPLAAWLDGRRQVAVAKDLGISKDHLSRLSSGRSRPSLALAQKITDYTGGRVPVSAWRGA